MMSRMRLIPCFVVLFLGGCESNGGGDSDEAEWTQNDPAPQIRFTSLRMGGTTDLPCTVSALSVHDEDNTRDTNWAITLVFDGSVLPTMTTDASLNTSIRVDAEDERARITSQDYVVGLSMP